MRKLGRIREPVNDIFEAASYSWRGHKAGDDIKEAVMALCNKTTRSNAFFEEDELEALSKYMKGSVLILRYSTTPIQRSVMLMKHCEHEPLVIAQELDGWSLLSRVLNFSYRSKKYDPRGGCDVNGATWVEFRPRRPLSSAMVTKSGNDTDMPP